MRESARRSVAAILLAALVAACGSTPASPSASATETAAATASPTPALAPTPSPTPSPTPAPTSTPTPVPVSVKLPSGWQSVPLTEEGFTSAVSALQAQNPELAQALQSMVTGGTYTAVRVFALRYTGGASTGSLVVTGLGDVGGVGLDTLGTLTVGSLNQLGVSTVKTTHVTLPAGDAVQLDFAYQVSGSTGSATLTDRVWLVAVGAGAYELAVTCASDVEACVADGSKIAESFSVAP